MYTHKKLSSIHCRIRINRVLMNKWTALIWPFTPHRTHFLGCKQFHTESDTYMYTSYHQLQNTDQMTLMCSSCVFTATRPWGSASDRRAAIQPRTDRRETEWDHWELGTTHPESWWEVYTRDVVMWFYHHFPCVVARDTRTGQSFHNGDWNEGAYFVEGISVTVWLSDVATEAYSYEFWTVVFQ